MHTVEVDKLADLRAQIDELEAQYGEIATKLKALGDGEYAGTEFNAHVCEISPSGFLDAKAAAEKLRELGVGEHWFAENTKTKKGYVALKLLRKKKSK